MIEIWKKESTQEGLFCLVVCFVCCLVIILVAPYLCVASTTTMMKMKNDRVGLLAFQLDEKPKSFGND